MVMHMGIKQEARSDETRNPKSQKAKAEAGCGTTPVRQPSMLKGASLFSRLGPLD